MPKDKRSYTDAELADAREVVEKQLGHELTDEEMRETFGRSIPRTGGSGPTDRSSRTIRVNEPDPSQSGRHAGVGRIARAFGFGKGGKRG